MLFYPIFLIFSIRTRTRKRKQKFTRKLTVENRMLFLLSKRSVLISSSPTSGRLIEKSKEQTFLKFIACGIFSITMEQQGLPVYNGPIDHLRYGFRSLESEMTAPHAVAAFQKNRGEAEWACKMDMVRRSYGSHLAMRLASERAMFSRPHRLPGLQSSNISLDTVMGTDSMIDFTDFLNGMI